MQFYAGAILERPPGPKYIKALAFAELALRGPLPKPKTLRSWRSDWPSGFKLALRVPEQAWVGQKGAFRKDSDVAEAQKWLFEAVSAVEASALVLRTDRRMSTGLRDREAFADYVSSIKESTQVPLVWSPTGLWESDLKRDAAEKLSITADTNPLESENAVGNPAYASLIASGSRRSFSQAILLDVLESVLSAQQAKRAFVAIESPASFREAQLLQSLATEVSTEAS